MTIIIIIIIFACLALFLSNLSRHYTGIKKTVNSEIENERVWFTNMIILV